MHAGSPQLTVYQVEKWGGCLSFDALAVAGWKLVRHIHC